MLKTSVLSLVRQPPTHTCDKKAVFSTRKKPVKKSKKKCYFFFSEKIVILANWFQKKILQKLYKNKIKNVL
jgi:hypothetical protein